MAEKESAKNQTDAPQGGTMIGVGQASALLMITDERMRQLARAGYMPTAEKGKVPLVAAVQGYIRFLKDEERRVSKSAAASKVQEARAREIDLRVAKEAGEMIAQDEVFAVIDLVFGILKSELVGMPARITRDLSLRRLIEKEVDGVLERTVARIAEAQSAFAKGEDPFTAVEENTAG